MLQKAMITYGTKVTLTKDNPHVKLFFDVCQYDTE